MSRFIVWRGFPYVVVALMLLSLASWIVGSPKWFGLAMLAFWGYLAGFMAGKIDR